MCSPEQYHHLDAHGAPSWNPRPERFGHIPKRTESRSQISKITIKQKTIEFLYGLASEMLRYWNRLLAARKFQKFPEFMSPFFDPIVSKTWWYLTLRWIWLNHPPSDANLAKLPKVSLGFQARRHRSVCAFFFATEFFKLWFVVDSREDTKGCGIMI